MNFNGLNLPTQVREEPKLFAVVILQRFRAYGAGGGAPYDTDHGPQGATKLSTEGNKGKNRWFGDSVIRWSRIP